MSEYSVAVRLRLGEIVAFKPEFDAVFNGFVDNHLPKQALLDQIKATEATKKASVHPDDQNILGNPRVLPKIQTEAEKLQEKHNRRNGEIDAKLTKEDQVRQKRLYNINPPKEAEKEEFKAMKDWEKHRKEMEGLTDTNVLTKNLKA